MYTEAKFEIIGRIGNVTELNGVVKMSIASEQNYKDDNGNWVENTQWNTVSVFGEDSIRRAVDKFNKGDLVKATGAIASSSYEKDGQTVYGVDLTCRKLNKLAAANRS